LSDSGAAAILFFRHCCSVKSATDVGLIRELAFKVCLPFPAQ